MKKLLLSATALTAISFSAVAADLPKRTAPAAAPAPIFTWTGFYAGVNLGGIGISSDNTVAGTHGDYYYGSEFITSETGAVTGNDRVRGTGLMGGLTVGYNYQINNIVVGLEADWALVNARANGDSSLSGVTVTGTPHIPNGLVGGGQVAINSLGTIRGRLGFAIDRTMIYGTAGIAIANTELSSVNVFTGERFGWKGTQVGYVVGGGVEHALANNLTLKGEVLYAKFRSKSVTQANPNSPCCASGFTARPSAMVARVGMNFKF